MTEMTMILDNSAETKNRQTDRERFLAIYDAHAPAVYRYLVSRLGNPAEAQDLTSQAVLAAWENFPRYREDGRAGAWLMSIARNKLMDFLRRERRWPIAPLYPETAGTGGGAGAGVEELERRTQLQTLVRQLPDGDRDLLLLRYGAGLPLAEIAAVLGRSEEAVKKAHQRLIGRLKAAMREAEDE